MANISYEVKQIALEIKKELENNPTIENLEQHRKRLEALRVQCQVQAETNRNAITKSLESYNNQEIKKELLEIFNSETMTGKEKLAKLQEIDTKVSKEYMDNLNAFINATNQEIGNEALSN